MKRQEFEDKFFDEIKDHALKAIQEYGHERGDYRGNADEYFDEIFTNNLDQYVDEYAKEKGITLE